MDFHGKDLGLLVSLDVLLSERSVTAAARRLGISQPAMSAQLARLRTMFGDELLVGHSHGMVPTSRAAAIHPALNAAIADLRALVAAAPGFDPANDHRHIRIACSDLAHFLLLPRIMPVLAAKAPGITVEALPPTILRLAEGMERGEIDFALTGADRAPQSFPARHLLDETFQVIWRPGHPLISGPPNLDQFCASRHAVAVIEDGSILDGVTQALRQLGRSRDVAVSVPNFLLLPSIVRATDLVSVVPSLLARAPEPAVEATVEAGELPFELPGLSIYLSWHRRHHQDPASQWFRQLVAEIAAEIQAARN
ncbi:LysR family transcriptional regulator [Paracoccus ravus]|uniref:LysR family transcriptional regulator n=1 Tax=Paracoccus ravus TaxID=2447760 RepID=UPI00143050D1|nr:LysR family transcriptional regulator [Paracoccus ravus]